jgi:alkylation response protein AidB-like acyl-CoA dehydrogenase
LAHWADWCFVVCRTEAGSRRHRGLSYLLCPMRQAGIDIRPIVQATGTSEFNEVFFDGARTPATNVVGSPGEGWRVAMGTLAFERGVATLAQQVGFERELDAVITAARDQAAATGDPLPTAIRHRLVDSWIGLRLLRYNALRTLSGGEREPGPEASIAKLQWGSWHRALGNLGVDVSGAAGMLHHDDATPLFLFSRADTIYGGSNQIQRNVIGERVLGLPKGPV